MHEDLVLGGPVWWFAAALLVFAGLLGGFVFFDSLFTRRAAFERLREPRWSYSVLQGIYLLFLLGAQVPGVPRIASGLVVLATPFAIAQALAYLLRAVFPSATEASGPSPNSDGPHTPEST